MKEISATTTALLDYDCIKYIIVRSTTYNSTKILIILYPSVCPVFTVDGSVQGSWNDTNAGQTVTINCQEKHVRDGSSERTCNSDGAWNIDPPLCRKLSKLSLVYLGVNDQLQIAPLTLRFSFFVLGTWDALWKRVICSFQSQH